MVEYSWCGRSEAELEGLRTLRFEDDGCHLCLRFDGWEFSSTCGFLDLMVWGGGPDRWQALIVGGFEPHIMLHLAGYLLDVSQGWTRWPDLNCSCEPGASFSARRDVDGQAVLSFCPGGRRSTIVLDGDPTSVSVRVSDEALVDAARWFCVEARRFDESEARYGWPPDDPQGLTCDELIAVRRSFLESESVRLDGIYAQLRRDYRDELARSDISAEYRAKIEFLLERIPEHTDWRQLL